MFNSFYPKSSKDIKFLKKSRSLSPYFNRLAQQILQLAQPIVDRCPHLIDLYGLEEKFMHSPLIGDNLKRSIFGGAGFLPV